MDAGWSGSEQKIQAAADSVFGLGARPESMLLTHLHPDHSGTTRQLAERWQQPAYVHPGELPLARGYLPEYGIPLDRWLMPLIQRLPTKTRARIAAGADLTPVVQAFDPKAGVPGLPGWEAIHTPGHTPGHFSLYRRSDGVLITGDAVVSVNLNSLFGVLFGRQGVFGPPRYSTWGRGAAVDHDPRRAGTTRCGNRSREGRRRGGGSGARSSPGSDSATSSLVAPRPTAACAVAKPGSRALRLPQHRLPTGALGGGP